MIELTEGVSAVTLPVQKTVNQSGISTPLANSRENKTLPNNVSLPYGDISFAASQIRNDHLNETAKVIRTANKMMDDVAKLIGDKREEIIQYEKQYPPFRNESSKKVEFLNSIKALKKQVDALTLVSDNKELSSIVSDQQPNSSGFLPTKAGEGSQIQLRQHEIHSGENGLNIASIDTNATDSEIRQFGRDLASANQTLENRRTGLAQDTRTISHEIAETKVSIGTKMLENEQEATQKSEEVKRVLSTLPDGSIGNGQSNEQGKILLERLR